MEPGLEHFDAKSFSDFIRPQSKSVFGTKLIFSLAPPIITNFLHICISREIVPARKIIQKLFSY